MNDEKAGALDFIRPRLTFLNESQKRKIHINSLEILSSTGIRVESEDARLIFKKNIGSSAVKDDLVFIPEEMVDYALNSAPSEVSIYDRKGTLKFQLPGETRFGIGATVLYYQDPKTDTVIPFRRSHQKMMVRLGDALTSYDSIATIGVIQDMPLKVADLYSTLDMMANTIKPLIVLVNDDGALPCVFDLIEHLHGELTDKPFIIPYFNPITPLIINKGTADKIITTIKKGLPFIYANYGMAGASTPITPAGELVLLNAELLGGVVFSQLMKEGASIILGSMPAYMAMNGMGTLYDPKSYLVNLAIAEMMRYYNLPHCGTSGAGMGWGPDLIASDHQWMNHLTCCIGKTGWVPFVGNILNAKVFSPNLVVYANEVIKQTRLLQKGFILDDTSLALDEIAQAGPGGTQLTSDLTLKLFREAHYVSELFPQLTLEKWQEIDCPQTDDLLRCRTDELLCNLDAPGDHQDLLDRGERWLENYIVHN